MIEEFHVTRLEWTYQLSAPFVQKLKSMGITVGGAIEDDSGSQTRLGRVTGEDGSLVTHRWFPKDRLVGCANAPEFRAAWLEEAKRSVDAGVDLMQQDDPQMALRTFPPLCHCAYCRAAFARYREVHGDGADYEQFQKESVLAFHRDMHRALDAYAGRHIPFSHNSTVGFSAKADWVSPAFDFINAEIDGKNTGPRRFQAVVAAAGGMPMVFSHRETNVEKNRRFFALTYATGTWMMLPWDVFMVGGKPRYFGTPAEYADLSGFVRANRKYLDGYEAAAAAGPGLSESANPPASGLTIEGGSGEVFAFARARPGEGESPVVIHVLDDAAEPKPFTISVRISRLGSDEATVQLREPKPYLPEEHERAQKSGDFSSLTEGRNVETTIVDGWLRVALPAQHPWGLLVISPKRPHSK
jgi:hypothetical protein